MEQSTVNNYQKLLLIVVAIRLVPIALSYGLFPQKSLSYLYDIHVSETNPIHILRAVMGLYLAMVIFWLIGVFNIKLREAALYSLVVFMYGLAAGRILSLLLDGVPHPFFLVYLILELGFGTIGVFLLSKSE